MNIDYVREMGSNYMVLSTDPESESYEYRIVSENHIEGLLPMNKSVVNGSATYYYSTNGYASMEKLYAIRSIDYDVLRSVLSGIADTADRLEEYLLDMSRVLLSPETVYIKRDSGETALCLYPDAESDTNAGMRKLAAFFMRKIDHTDERSVKAVCGLMEFAEEEGFDVDALRKICGQAECDDVPQIAFDMNESYTFECDTSKSDNLFDEIYNDYDIKEDDKDGKESTFDKIKRTMLLAIPATAVMVLVIILLSM